MKSKRLQTNFLRFVREKYNTEIQELPEEETNYSKDISDEYDEIMNYGDEENDEVQDEIENDDDDDDDDENIDKLVKEYQILEKKLKLKSNGRIYNKRK